MFSPMITVTALLIGPLHGPPPSKTPPYQGGEGVSLLQYPNPHLSKAKSKILDKGFVPLVMDRTRTRLS
jgi:hypothetical protein